MDRKDRIAISLYVVLIGVLASLYSAYGSDEAFYMNVAKDIVDGKGYTGNTIAPVFPSLIAGFHYFFDVESSGKIVSMLSLFITAFIVYHFAKEVFGKKSVWPVLFFISLPMAPILGSRILPDATFNMFVVLTLFLFYKAMKDRPMLFLPAGAFLAVAFFTRYAAVLLIPVMLIYLFMDRKHFSLFKRKEFYLGIAAFLLVFTAINIVVFGTKLDHLQEALFSYTYTTEEEPSYYYAMVFPLVPLFILPLFGYGIAKIGKSKVIGWLAASIAFIVAYKLFLIPVREYRYLFDISIFVVLISFYGFMLLSQSKKRNFFHRYVKQIAIVLISINLLAGIYIAWIFIDYPRYNEVKIASGWALSNCNLPLVTNAGRQVMLYTDSPIIEMNSLSYGNANCILYSPYEPAIQSAIDGLQGKEELYKVGRVIVYRN